MIILSIATIVVSAAPPSVSSISSATYTENDQMTIDPAISVTGDEAVSDAKVSIGTGYVSSEDSLTYITTNGVTGSFNTGTGILSLTGGSLPSDYQAAFRNVKYYNNKDNPNTNQRVITFAIGNSLYYPGTGHYYEYVASSITWDAARTAADARRLYGLQGYLATITSAGENDFIQSKVAGDAWIGASDSSGESAWRWMTGPEGTEESGLGRRFWQGTWSGSVISGYYNKWASGEPNDYNSGSPGEDYAYMISDQDGTWNDYPTASSLSYFTEYGGRAGDPVLNLTATVTVNVTAINDAPTTPGAFTSPTTGQTKTGSQPITVIWGSSTDPDGDTVKYDLWYFNGTWTQIGNLLTGTSMIYNLPADNTNSAMFRVYANDTVLNSSARDVTFTVDTAPTFTIQYYSDSGLTASLGDRPKLKAGTYYIKITSSEALSGTPTISIDAEGTANDETNDATSTVSGNDYRYTRTIASDAAAVGSLLEDISITGTDAASNTAANVNPTNEATKAAYIDTTAPTVTITMDDAALNVGDTSTVTFTFSEAPTGFTTEDVTVGTGSIGVINTTNPLIQTAIYTPTDNIDVGTNVFTVGTGWTDAALNTGVGDDSANYAVDTIEPTVTVTMDDAALNVGDTSTVTFTFSEAPTGFTTEDVTVGTGSIGVINTTNPLIQTVIYTPTNDIEAAINVIALAMTGVTDTAGNAGVGSTDSSNYAIDTKEPTFTILYYSDTNLAASLGDNPMLKGGTYYIKITSSETLSGTPTISIDAEGTANDATVEASVAVSGNDYRYTRTIAADAAAVGSLLEDISITGTDAASNTVTNMNPTDEASKAAYIDTISPSITIISPVNMTYGNTSVVLNVTTNQAANATYSLNEDTNQSLYNMTTGGNTTITGMEGANNITVYANDPAGNTNSSIVYFVVDTTAPSLSITRVTSPTNITYQNITGTVSDTGGVGIGTVTVNGIAATNGTGYYYYNLTGLELGNNTITVIATDLAENAATNITYILVIPEVPAITGYAPSSSVSDSTGAARTFNISTDQVVNVTWYLNGTQLFTNTSVTEANYTNSSAGSGTWNVTAIANNTNGTDSREWTWIVMTDNMPPVITISAPVNNENISIFDRIISGGITDESAITANMYVNSVFANTWSSKGSFRRPSNFTNGANTINISATDAYNNINWTNISVFVISPVNEASVNLTVNQSVNITANDSAGVDVVLSTGNNTANITVKINASINASYFNVSDIDTEFVTLGIAKKSLVRFVEINATGDVVNLSSVKITMFFNDSDLDLNGNGKIDAGDIKEDTLNLYWYRDNATSGSQEWFPLTLGADYSDKLDRQNNSGPIVISVEKNTAFKYISASTNHFSFYSIAGAPIPATTTTIAGSGGSGSGGSGVVTAESSENIAFSEMIERNLETGKPVTYSFTKNQDVIYEVLVTGKENEYDVSMRIEILKNRSKQAKENAPGLVYRNANIISGTKNIGENVIKFKVNDSWLLENGFDSSDIRLVKWVDNKWITLETVVLFNKDGYTHFSAKSMTFSIYAITGIKKEEMMPSATEKTAVTPEAAPLSTEEQTPAPEGKTPLWIWMILAMLLIAALVYALKRR